MESLSIEKQDLIKKITLKSGIDNFRLDISKTVCGDGDGYIGILEALDIVDKESDRKLNLVLKRAPTNKQLRKQFPTRLVFLREIVIYDEVFPEFKTFQDKYGIVHPFECGTDFYGFITDEYKEALVLKNLKEDGFRMYDRKHPMDNAHLSLVLTTYGRLHAVSLAMRRLEPDRFEKITSKVGENVMLSFKNSMNTQAGNNSDRVKDMGLGMFSPTLEAIKDNIRITERVRGFLEDSFEFYFKELGKSEFAVVAHADCWGANMMFKYEDESKLNFPTKVNLIDWQMSYVTHLIHDVSYFFYISAGKHDLRNYKQYLSVYYRALCKNLVNFGLDPESIYPFEVLEEHWKKFSKLGFFMCLIMMHQSLSDKKTHDFEKMAEEDQNLFDLRQKTTTVSDRFKQRMTDLVEFLVDNDFI